MFTSETIGRHHWLSPQVDLLLLNALLSGSSILNQLIHVVGYIVDTAFVQLLGHVLSGSKLSEVE